VVQQQSQRQEEGQKQRLGKNIPDRNKVTGIKDEVSGRTNRLLSFNETRTA
jgi:hypothetical protein